MPVTAYAATWDIQLTVQDSEGHLWTKLPGSSFVSVFAHGAWSEARLPDGAAPVQSIMGAQALADGGLVVVGNDHRAFLRDHGVWAQYASIDELVERQFERLSQLISDQAGRGGSMLLRRDTGGNIWTVNWDDTRAYTGKAWVHMASTPTPPAVKRVVRLIPSEGGAKMLIIGDEGMAFGEINEGRMRLTRFPQQPYDALVAASYNRYGLFIDSKGRSWVPTNHEATLCLDKNGARDIPGVRYPRLEDHAGRIWFLDKWTGKITLLLPDGRRSQFADDSLGADSSVVEDQPNSFWVTTVTGLAHFQLDDSGARPVLKSPGGLHGEPSTGCRGPMVRR